MSKCIVCGKPIAKRTHQFSVRAPRPAIEEQVGFMPAMPAIPDGTVNKGHTYTEIFLDNPPREPEQLVRWTNHKVIRFERNSRGEIVRFSTWDGESYRDPHFHSETCAARQGRASAKHGDRYTWRKP